MKEALNIEGVVENVIYHNEDNGFTVFALSEAGKNDKNIICTGSLPRLSIGETVKLRGFFVNNRKYGIQLSVDYIEKNAPTTIQGIEKYLGSGVIKGIGERLAKRIVEAFGERTLTVIDETPERLAEVKGITLEKAAGIGSVFHEQFDLRRAVLFLQDYGISPTFAQRVYKRFREATQEIVKSNPYILAEEITGIGFKTADAIAARVGMPFDSPHRVKAGLKYILSQAVTNGHVYLPKQVLLDDTAELLRLSHDLVETAFIELSMERQLVAETQPDTVAVYQNAFFYAENYVAKKLADLVCVAPGKHINAHMDISRNISRIEAETGVALAADQKRAVEEALKSGVLVITGGPGTGKTTTINAIIKLMWEYGLKIELAAPTGRAAKRMSETTGMDAKTIHRLLEISCMSDDPRRQTFSRNEDNPIETDVIIIDESSMVDILLMHHLLKAVAPGTRLILVGDVDQLPSVGPGNVLRDIIDSGRVDVARLTEIFRQAQESAIVMNAHRINHGKYPALNDKNKDFFFIKRCTADETEQTIVQLVTQRLPGYMGCDMFSDIQVLTPTRKSAIGVSSLNTDLQRCMNPPSSGKREKEYRNLIFREGDKVMQIKNNYSVTWRAENSAGRVLDEGVGVFNGDQGCITEINEEDEYMTVKFDDDRVVKYGFSQLDELELSFAVTVHKAQGSEYKVVVIPIHSGPPMLMSKNLLYTAVTRAKNLVVIVGTEEMLKRMIANNRETQRYTLLAARIKKIMEEKF
ncbi:MAG: ATP-dependent RecD-like DNA helicase [Clostridiales bacterium]|jgi:exodeoxyribonuclease V alpha subunit|nr:ATP-dependent RecD-like DNA helicase [Clostridiales bacterium]